ncbi:outer membrane protein [Sulfitobacter sp. CW3]|uniref:outer membrane protein n=1 Tax=Sulfitobacter sp. CW3 TaxID=2861965 RepID=UPI001C6067BA|nr:outer membrane beta-barrel protein [Sulfitobacter sp. CW3]MBW4960727.1 outer membrane beta-barrel protein [Sulfitobacter sp. CW3]
MKRSMKYTMLATAATFAMGGSVLAGSLEEPIVEPVMTAPVVVPDMGGNWTGFYTGLQLGYGDADGPGALDGDNGSYGFHAGYDYDFGKFVLGGELDYDKTDIDLNGGAATIDSVARAKIKGGYDLGNTLIYATGGYALADTSGGDEDGGFYGIGMSYKVSEQYTVGAELLEHKFKDIGGTAGNDLDATTFTLRGSYRF